MLMGWKLDIDWRFYADVLALLLSIVLGLAVAYQFENGAFHRGPTVIEVDTGLLRDERTGPAINWGGKHGKPPAQTQESTP